MKPQSLLERFLLNVSMSAIESPKEYDGDDGVNTTQVNVDDLQITTNSQLDGLGRKVSDEVRMGSGIVSRQFSYHAGVIPTVHQEHGKVKGTATTQLISQIVLSDGRTLTYEYDNEEALESIITKLKKVKSRIGKIAVGVTILSTIASLGEKIAKLGSISKVVTECVMEAMKSALEELLKKALKALLKLIPTVGVVLGLFAKSIASSILSAVFKGPRIDALKQRIQASIEVTTYSVTDYFVVFFKSLA